MKNVDEEIKKFVQDHEWQYFVRIRYHIVIQDAFSMMETEDMARAYKPFESITKFVEEMNNYWEEHNFYRPDLNDIISIICDQYYEEFERMNKNIKRIQMKERTWPRLI